jgi:hypothetical protein
MAVAVVLALGLVAPPQVEMVAVVMVVLLLTVLMEPQTPVAVAVVQAVQVQSTELAVQAAPA